MKKIFTFLGLLGLIFNANAQLANPDFENWESPLLNNSFNVTGSLAGITFYVCAPNFTYNELENWSSTNQLTNTPAFGSVELVTESPTAYSGTKSVQITSQDITITGHLAPGCIALPQTIDNVAPGLIVNGSFSLEPQELIDELVGGTGLDALNPFTYPGVGEAIDFIPKSISGYYQYTGGNDGTNTDSCIIVSGLKKDGEIIGHVVTRLADAASWTPFSIDYTHITCDTPDTIVTVISSSSIDLEIVNNEFIINSDFTGIDGSVLLIDDIHIDTIAPADLPPLLAPDESNIFISQVATVDVLTNDVFCDMGTYAPVVIPSSVTNGSAATNGSNQIEYTPPVSYTGTEVFNYYICNAAMTCDTTTVTINVNPIAECYANDDTRTLNLATDATDYFDPRVNDVDCGSNITIVPGFEPSIGTAVVESNNYITYSPNNTSGGSDMFKYYTCNATNTNQCDTATVNISIISGINDLADNVISFYPNPAKTVLNIGVDLPSEIIVTIYNTMGAKMISDAFYNTKEISLTNLTNGLYFAEIAVDGKKSIRKFQVIK